MLKCLCLAAMILPTVAEAQVRVVDDTTFDTRDEAIDALLPNDNRFPVIPGVDDGDFGLSTNCAIGARPSELTVLDTTFQQNVGPIGPNLSRHCDGGTNQSTGVALGGGLGSLQPFRTVAIPQLDRAEEEGATGEPKPALGFLEMDGDFALRLATSRAQFSLGIERTDLTLTGTQFSARAEIDGIEATLGGTWTNASGDRTFGANFTYGDYEGRLASHFDTVATFENTDLDSLAQERGVTIADICGIPGGGSVSSRLLAMEVFGRASIGAESFVDYGIGASRTRDNHAIQNCIINEFFQDNDGLNEVFAGTLSAGPVTSQLEAFVTVGHRLSLGAATLSPSAGLGLSVFHRGSYAEAERPAGTTVDFPGIGADGEPTLPLGTALVFEDSRTTRAKLRLGLELEAPFQAGATAGTLRVGGGLNRLFGDGQERVTARFLEDGRDDPLNFSFLDRPVDRTWGDVAVDVSLPVGDRGRFNIGAETMVGNDFIDRLTIHAGFTVTF